MILSLKHQEECQMFSRIKDLLIGPALPTQTLGHKQLNKIRALAAFSPDALASIAYANQEIYLGLIAAGSLGLAYALPIGLAITGVLVMVALSYYQTIQGYPSGGGSYIVARANLGVLPGLVAAAALMIDYVLNAAVSLTAGVAALASAFPVLWSYRVPLALALLLVITLVNLRGLRESGTFMAVPVYLFLATYLSMLAYGLVRLFIEGPTPVAISAAPAIEPLTLILVLHAFSTGCTALTGIEAISNGVPAFNPPQSRNAGRTLIVMALLMGALFLGQYRSNPAPGGGGRPAGDHFVSAGTPFVGQWLPLSGYSVYYFAYSGGGSQHQLRRFSARCCHPGKGWFFTPPAYRAWGSPGFYERDPGSVVYGGRSHYYF